MKIMAKIFIKFVVLLFYYNRYVESECVGGGCDPNDPNSFRLSIEQMCELVPERGHGQRDIVRIYFNPVLQQCLPFSWSGEGGNANRFVSIKNCYEICHPADPGQRPMKGSGTRAYFVKKQPPLHCDENKEGIPELGIAPVHKEKDKKLDQTGSDVVIRQIPHPLDSSKTLTIVQPVKWLVRDPYEVPKVIVEKHIRHVPVYIENPTPPSPTIPPLQSIEGLLPMERMPPNTEPRILEPDQNSEDDINDSLRQQMRQKEMQKIRAADCDRDPDYDNSLATKFG